MTEMRRKIDLTAMSQNNANQYQKDDMDEELRHQNNYPSMFFF
jgi:hypothetical protein